MPAESEIPPTSERPALDDHDRRGLQSTVRRHLREFVDPFDNSAPWFSFDAMLGRWEHMPSSQWIIDFPPLLSQVRMAVDGVKGAAGATGTFESRPAAGLDAIDVEQWITEQTGIEARRIGLSADPDPAVNIRAIEARVTMLGDQDLIRLRHAVRQWWVSAKVVAGFEEPPLRPHVRCPMCDRVDSIRIRIDAAGREAVARCKECGEVWDQDTIGVYLVPAIEEATRQREQLREMRRKAGLDEGPSRKRRQLEYIALGSESEARAWAISHGVDPETVYPADRGLDPLREVEYLPRAVVRAARGELSANSLEVQAAMRGLRAQR